MVPVLATPVPIELSTYGPSDLGRFSLNSFAQWLSTLRSPCLSIPQVLPSQFFFFTMLCLLSTLPSAAAPTADREAGTPVTLFLYYVWGFWFSVSVWFLLPSSIEFEWVPLVTCLAEEQSSHSVGLELRNCWEMHPSSNLPSLNSHNSILKLHPECSIKTKCWTMYSIKILKHFTTMVEDHHFFVVSCWRSLSVSPYK